MFAKKSFYVSKDYDSFLNAQRDIGVVLTEEMETELRGMAIYQQDLSWKMFVPPLPVHQVSKLLIKTFLNKTI